MRSANDSVCGRDEEPSFWVEVGMAVWTAGWLASKGAQGSQGQESPKGFSKRDEASWNCDHGIYRPKYASYKNS